jgi:hypothetical protein
MGAAGKTPAKRRIEPFAQGDLDGMCAIYTIINAVRALCPEMTTGASMALFRRLIRSLDTHTNDALSPIIIGTKRSLLQKLLMEAQSHVAKRLKSILRLSPKGMRSKHRRSTSLGTASRQSLMRGRS